MIFSHTRNTRCIIKNNYRFIRSDVPAVILENELEFLKQHHILTIIDLRTEEEQLRKPCPLKNHADFYYFSMPVSGGDTVPESPEQVAFSYLAMVDSQMYRIIDKILNADTNVLYFCNAGKDRTGVVSALLLEILGYDEAYIIQDYMQSAENLKELLQQFAESNPEISLEVITPHEHYMKEFLYERGKNMNPFMKIAIEEARNGIQSGHGGPFGCVITKDGEIVGRGHNEVIKQQDPTCHGEMMAIHDACKTLGTFSLSGCELYTTAEPCPMCLGAIRWANIKKVYYGCRVSDTEQIGFRDKEFFTEEWSFSEELDRLECLKVFEEYQNIRNKKHY